MVEDLDFRNLLQTGHWTTSGSKGSGRSRSPGRRAFAPHLDPFRTPRYFGREEFLRYQRYPPSPSVEDEAEAILREHGSSLTVWPDEEPKYPGHADQLPVILPSPEANPERRFILVTPPETGNEDVGEDQFAFEQEEPPAPASPSFKSGYQANVSRKYESVDRDENAKRPPTARRKSRVDLPRIETDLLPDVKSPGTDKAKSATYIDPRARGYFDYHDESSRPTGQEPLLSPVIKHATKGRDRAYWDFNAGAQGARSRNRPSYPRMRSPVEDRRISDSGLLQPPSASTPTLHRRSVSAVEAPPPDFRHSYSNLGSYREEIASSRPRRRDPSPSPTHRKPLPSPPRLNRVSSSPTREPSGRGSVSRRSSVHHRHHSRHDDDFYSSDEDEYHPRRDRRKSIITQDHGPLLSPDLAHAPHGGSRRASRNTTPLASPSTSQAHFALADPSPGPRASQTFPPSSRARRRGGRAVSPSSEEDSSEPRSRSRLGAGDGMRGARSRSRAASLRSSAGASKAATLPMLIPINSALSPVEQRRSPVAPPSPSPSRHSSFEGSPPRDMWQPGSFSSSPPARDADAAQPVITSYRRYAEDVSLGRLPGFPRCPRQVPGRGGDDGDWLTLPRCDNFSICPSCYEHVFARTAFGPCFVPAPRRPAQQQQQQQGRPAGACDFGAASSPWYRIAWLMTLKYGHPDLRLVRGVAAAAARLDPCPGGQPARRAWCSIRDPATGRGIPGFSVCARCARSAEALFPNLTGAFVPLAAHEPPGRDVCALRFAPDRGRFAEYFGLLEAAHDRALGTRSPPDVARLASRVRDAARLPECRRDVPLRGASWLAPRRLPDLTVCPACYHDAVVVGGAGGGGRLEGAEALRFERERPPDAAACQLYSARMREALRAAARRGGDLAPLEAALEARRAGEAGARAALGRIQRAGDLDDAEKRAEMERVVERWRASE